jgi:hypothetical protein
LVFLTGLPAGGDVVNHLPVDRSVPAAVYA